MKVLLGDYPVTHALRSGALKSPTLPMEFADVRLPQHAFKRLVNDLEFDLAEIAVVTFLLARAHGRPYRLLPAVVMARSPHGYLCYNAARGPLFPGDLNGKTVGKRSYSVTTSTWIREILFREFGVHQDKVNWVTFEAPHLAEFRDPPNVTRAPEGRDMESMLLSGELDAAILGDPPKDPRIRPLISDPEGAAREWRLRTGAIHINHMVVAKNTVSREQSDLFFSLLKESREKAGKPDMTPFGLEENRRNLEVAIETTHRQGLIPRRFTVEELFE
jgi:4,5-dihydroxyphthalate decarboxylase